LVPPTFCSGCTKASGLAPGWDTLDARLRATKPAVSSTLARKRILPPSAGTFPTRGLQFVLLVSGVILIVGGLTY
jgi:hypothetical protein